MTPDQQLIKAVAIHLGWTELDLIPNDGAYMGLELYGQSPNNFREPFPDILNSRDAAAVVVITLDKTLHGRYVATLFRVVKPHYSTWSDEDIDDASTLELFDVFMASARQHIEAFVQTVGIQIITEQDIAETRYEPPYSW